TRQINAGRLELAKSPSDLLPEPVVDFKLVALVIQFEVPPSQIEIKSSSNQN
ncbi:unnamed protein product, partial [Allacma fusca]